VAKNDALSDFGYPVVDIPPSVTDAGAAVRFLVAQFVHSGQLNKMDADVVACDISRREVIDGPAGATRGFAIAHTRSASVAEVLGIVGRCTVPIAWPAARVIPGWNDEPAQVVCLLVKPASKPREGLRTLEEVARQIRTRISQLAEYPLPEFRES
jgi:mannitol/fructose-specific phosphotransferase system IIA component (Ntr-type)